MGLDSIEGFNLIALRFGIAFIIAGVVFYKRFIHIDFHTIKYGFLLGTILFTLVSAVTIGVKFTSISNAGFLFALSVVFVPLLLVIFFRKKTEKKVVFGVVISIRGIALLTLNNKLEINLGDLLVILGAVFYAIYIKTHTGLIFSLEPVFAALFAFIFADEILPAKGYVGAILLNRCLNCQDRF
jgi:drug/metabolite transporter (DMT)-like permease